MSEREAKPGREVGFYLELIARENDTEKRKDETEGAYLMWTSKFIYVFRWLVHWLGI